MKANAHRVGRMAAGTWDVEEGVGLLYMVTELREHKELERKVTSRVRKQKRRSD